MQLWPKDSRLLGYPCREFGPPTGAGKERSAQNDALDRGGQPSVLQAKEAHR